LAAPVPTLEPPVAEEVPEPAPPVAALVAGPPAPAVPAEVPPPPPEPPTALMELALAAPPLSPETAVAFEDAPEFELLRAVPSLVAAPVAGGRVVEVVVVELDVVELWATAGPAPRKTSRAATSAPTAANALEIFFAVPGLPVFMLVPCRCWSPNRVLSRRCGKPIRRTSCLLLLLRT